MIKPINTWRGYPNAAALICDGCGATISEGENPDRAVERAPQRTILVRRVIATAQGLKHDERDYCSFSCQIMHGMDTDESLYSQESENGMRDL